MAVMNALVTPLIVLLALLVGERPPLHTFQAGEVIVASAEPHCLIDPPPPAADQVTLHGRDASLVREVTAELIGTARYAQGFIYVAHQSATSRSLSILTSSGEVAQYIPLQSRPISAIGASGNEVLAVVYDGAQPSLWRLHSDMVAIAALPSYTHFITAIDVAADHCTMFYTTVDSIERFDICTNRPLATFARTPATDVRVLPDGSILAASGTALLRYDSFANLISRFTLTSGREFIGAISLDANPSLAWVVTTYGCDTGPSHVMQVNVATGYVTAGPRPAPRSNGYAIAVQGEWQAAVDKPPAGPRRRAVR
jgi:hypothetical protein